MCSSDLCFIRSPDRALRAMAAVTAHGRLGRMSHDGGTRAPALPESLAALPLPGTGTLSETHGKAYLATLGIAVPKGELATDAASACRIARGIGYPVVLKAQSPALPHKSDAGGVIVGIADDASLTQAWERLHANVARSRPDLVLEGVLVEAMAPAGGVELVVGARRDPQWGPVVMAGLGGIWIEALRDVRLMACDLDERAIIAELGRLRGAALLSGMRGSAAVDIAAVARVIARIGALMRARPEILEIDINPLLALPEGVLALDVLLVAQ